MTTLEKILIAALLTVYFAIGISQPIPDDLAYQLASYSEPDYTDAGLGCIDCLDSADDCGE